MGDPLNNLMPEPGDSKGRATHFEQDLKKIAGVKHARVIGDPIPSEIHLVASSTRPPKQLVRDVQSLAAAAYDMKLDHRIVSIVQQEDAEPDQPKVAGQTLPDQPDTPDQRAEADLARPILDSVVVASKGASGWVKLRVQVPNGEICEGTAPAFASREARARGSAIALLHALEKPLERMGAHVELGRISLYPDGEHPIVLLQATFFERDKATPITGSAMVVDDAATAAARALLQALNRKLRFDGA